MLDIARRALDLSWMLHRTAPDYARQAIGMAAAHPMGAVGCAVAVILYLRLMMSGPRHS